MMRKLQLKSPATTEKWKICSLHLQFALHPLTPEFYGKSYCNLYEWDIGIYGGFMALK